MTMTEMRPAADVQPGFGGRRQRVYAIAFDMDTKALRDAWNANGGSPRGWRAAYPQMGEFLSRYGFTWQQGSLQFSSADTDPVTVVLAVQEMTKQFPWFAPSVRDIRMLRIEENNDLRPAVESIAPLKPHPAPEIIDLFTAMDQDYD